MELDVIQYAKQERSIKKTIDINHIAKLEDLVVDDRGSLAVDLKFFINDHGLPAVKGQISGDLELVCQRCMKPMPYNLALDLGLVLLSQDQNMPDLKTDLEPFIYDSIQVNLFDLISDDIILSLPQVAKHVDEQCNPFKAQADITQEEAYSESVMASEVESVANEESPFAALKEILKG